MVRLALSFQTSDGSVGRRALSLSVIGCDYNRQWASLGADWLSWTMHICFVPGQNLAVRTSHLAFFTSLSSLEATALLVVKSGCEIRALLVAFVFLTSEDAATG